MVDALNGVYKIGIATMEDRWKVVNEMFVFDNSPGLWILRLYIYGEKLT